MVTAVRVLSKALKATPETNWDKEELLDAIYWVRQILGAAAGTLWGLIPLTGFYAFFWFVALEFALVYVWYSNYLRLDEEDFGGHQELLGEGLGPSISFFLLTWIISYTLVQS